MRQELRDMLAQAINFRVPGIDHKPFQNDFTFWMDVAEYFTHE